MRDNRPKRRKYKDNPYTIKYDEKLNKYSVAFFDSKGIKQSIEISYELYCLFDRFELDDLSELNEYDRHIEHVEHTDESLYNKTKKVRTIDEDVEESILNENIYKAINRLSDTQKKRIKMYYFEDMTLEEIAKIEKTTFQAISKSIKNGIDKIKQNLKY